MSVCPSIRLSVRGSVHPSVVPSCRKLTSIPASISQNVTNKSCLLCIKSEKYASWVTLDPSGTAVAEAKPRCVYSILKPHCQSFRRQIRLLPSKATLREFQTKTFVHLPRVGPKQLCAPAHLGSTRAAGTS